MGFRQEVDAPQYVRLRGLQELLVVHRYVIDAIPRFEALNLPHPDKRKNLFLVPPTKM